MRGVNKLVVEVRPDGDYFEKAILFIRPDKRQVTQKEISDNAEKLLSDIENTQNNKMTNPIRSFILIFAGLTAGSLISFIAMFIFHLN